MARLLCRWLRPVGTALKCLAEMQKPSLQRAEHDRLFSGGLWVSAGAFTPERNHKGATFGERTRTTFGPTIAHRRGS